LQTFKTFYTLRLKKTSNSAIAERLSCRVGLRGKVLCSS